MEVLTPREPHRDSWAGWESYLVKMSSKVMPKEHCVMKVNNSLNDFFSLEPKPLIKWKKKKSYGHWMTQRWNKINRAEMYNKQENVAQVAAWSSLIGRGLSRLCSNWLNLDLSSTWRWTTLCPGGGCGGWNNVRGRLEAGFEAL